MKSIILGIILAFSVVGLAHANPTTVTTTQGLTDAQKAELAASAAKMASDNANTIVDTKSPTKSVEVVTQWVDIGTAIGSGLAASAKELGIAANDFAQTPVGRFTVFLIAWHFVGGTILHVFFALLWFFVMGGTLFYIWCRSFIKTTITTYEKDKGPNNATKVQIKEPIIFKTNDELRPIHLFLGFGFAIYIIILSIMLLNL
jgi:hypothetical protein